MNIKNTIYTFATLFIVAISLRSCKPDSTKCDNCETELITSVNIALTDSATGMVTQFKFRDLDGDGANAPIQFDTIKLLANRTYTALILVLDESKSPSDTISNEILEEANDHQFFFHSHDISVNFSYLDFDTHTPPMPVGLNSKWYVGNVTGYGKIRIELKHQPSIKVAGNDQVGETDLDIDFNALVQ